jgi:8-amino-7-oxononanoate synthase
MSEIVLSSAAKPAVELQGRSVIYFGGTNYLGMSFQRDVILAAQEGLIKWGLSSAGSRETTGSAAPHLELEERLERFLGRENVISYCSGYSVNLVLLQALRQEYQVCLVDDGAHCSVKDAVAGAAMQAVFFRHRDPDDLEAKLREHCSGRARPLVCTDGVFAAGTLAPLAEYRRLAGDYGGAVVMDDAHGVGVLGRTGKGTLEHLGVESSGVYQTGTLSKAFGCFGGYAAGDEPIARLIRRRSPAYIGATPLPPAIARAAITSIDFVDGNEELRSALRANIGRLKAGLKSLGVEFEDGPTPIMVFVPGDRKYNERIHRQLLDRDILIPYNFYPGGPEEGFFRMVATAAHTPQQIDKALDALGELMRQV